MRDTNNALEEALELHRQGQLEKAALCYQAFLHAQPSHIDAAVNYALLLAQQSEFTAAIAMLTPHFERVPNHPGVNHVMGRLHRAKGNTGRAIEYLSKAIELKSDFAPAMAELGQIHAEQNRHKDALSLLKKAATLRPEPHILNNLGNVYRAMGDAAQAKMSYQKALELDPSYTVAEDNLRGFGMQEVPLWHFDMLSDDIRNLAFEAAIKEVVSSNTRVLDIGTGSGLLAMMAVRTGAESVIACEVDPNIATIAQQVVNKNGYQNQIKILNKKSSQLSVGSDLEPVDLIVAEVLDPVVIGEGVLPTLRHAVSQFLKPGGQVIPARATLYAGLAELPRLRQVNPVGDVCGFDLSAFDEFRNPAAGVGLRLDQELHRFLSDPFVVEAFDFYQVPPQATNQNPHTAEIQVPITANGLVHAIVCWFDVWLNDDIVLSSRPNTGRSHWEQAAQFLPDDKAVSKEDVVTVAYGRNDMQMRFALT